jgi:hypothetical protein
MQCRMDVGMFSVSHSCPQIWCRRMPVITATKERVQKERVDVLSTRMELNHRQMMYLAVAENVVCALLQVKGREKHFLRMGLTKKNCSFE